MNAMHLYQHPDGSFIDFDTDTGLLIAYEDMGPTVGVPVGPVGLVELGKKLIELGTSLQGETA
jgi:hypothetical protein